MQTEIHFLANSSQRNIEPSTSRAEPSGSNYLDSWKQIATYLTRDVRTVQRWEKKEGLPVHRHFHDRLGTVYAYKSELDAWWRGRVPRLKAERLGAGTVRARTRLAVLPFENLSGDPEQERFSDGLTEEVIAQLGRLDPLRLGVIARTTIMQYKRVGRRIGEIAQELCVDHLLEGSVRRAGDRMRITTQLIQASDQTHFWAETYDRDLADVLTIQRDVAECISRSLESELLPLPKASTGPNQKFVCTRTSHLREDLGSV